MVCSICFEDVCQDESKTISLSCKHSFHRDCMKEWIFSKSDPDLFIIKFSCPNCRKKFTYTNNNCYNFVSYEDKMVRFIINYTLVLIFCLALIFIK